MRRHERDPNVSLVTSETLHGSSPSSTTQSSTDSGAPPDLGAERSTPAGLVERPLREGRPSVTTLRRQAINRRSLAIADMLAAALALLLCVGTAGEDDSLRTLTLLAPPLVVIAGKLQRLYERDELVLNKSTIDEAPKLFHLATFFALLVYVFDEQLITGTLGSRQILALWISLFLFTVVARWLARSIVRRAIGPERCVFVGSDGSYERLAHKLATDNPPAVLVGRLTLSPSANAVQLAGASDRLHQMATDLDANRVVIEPSQEAPEHALDFVREAKASGVPVSLLPRVLDVVGAEIEIDDVDGLTLLGVRQFGLSRSSQILKRSFDVAGATVGLLVLAPFLVLIAVLIKLDSRGPILFRQTRIGRDGRAFEIWKFRSMVSGADAEKARLRTQNEAAAGLFKIADDPRLTRVGRMIRRRSLDELPQLVNVVRGEMSLVGPRPLVCDEDEQIVGWDRRRLQLTPGMTGRWQVLGSSRVPLAEMVKLDYLYVAGWSLWSDVKILLRTLAHVGARRGQ